MKTFFNILQTVTNKKNKTYPDEPFKLFRVDDFNIHTEEINHIDFLINTIFYNEKNSKYLDQNMRNSQAKFGSLNCILDNTFNKNEFKEKILTIFSKSQKCYYAFSRLARIYKNKKYAIVVSNDLMLNPLDINNNNTFMLIQNKSKYLFSLNDLVTIIETAISNSPNFFSEPLSPLNPYNKEQFTNSTLYNIYFKLKESGRLMSILFHLFFLENFNKEHFLEKNEPVIRENAIKKYVYNSPYTVLHTSVLTMLRINPYTKQYNIHENFPKDILVDIFRPFLFYFFIINYDIKNTSKIYKYKQILYTKLKKFYEYNKSFGRQYIKLTTRFHKIIKKEFKFNTDHISFYKIPIKNEHIYNELFIFGNSATINISVSNPPFNIDVGYLPDEENDIEDNNTEDNNTDDNNTDDNNTEEELGLQNIITEMNNQINEMVIQNQQIYDVDNDDENSFNNSDDAPDSIS